MLIFIVPAWHPTPTRPTWANWILPHIDMTKQLGKVVVLQVDQDAAINSDQNIIKNAEHYYLASPIKKNRLTRTKLGYRRVLTSFTKDLDSLYKEAIKEYGTPDIIHAHVSMPAGYSAAIIGNKYNIPVVVTEHYSGFFSDIRFPWRIKQYYQEMRKRIAGFYVVSPGFKKNIEAKTSIKVNGVLPNPINVNLFSPSGERQIEPVLRLISTGDVCMRKGTDILLQAVNNLPEEINWQLTIIGTQPSDNAEWELLKHPKVKLLPRKNQDELVGYYSNSDVFIVSSRVETANVSMLEAMACGCYVITSKIGAPESLLDNTVAEFFTSENADELCEKILTLPKVDRCTQRDYVLKNYSKNEILTRLQGMYNDTLVNSEYYDDCSR
jgi:glycosyltransferase involved in cell wall biosynthesis